MSDLTDVIKDGEIITRKNSALNDDVRVKRGGMKEGLVHLIDHRIRERVLNEKVKMDIEQAKKETSAILFLAIDNIDKAPAVKEPNGNYGIYHKGIKTIITQDKKGHYVLSGYDNNQTKQEATESINAVIAQYGNTPEFLGIYTQVGAVIASNQIIPQQQEKSNQKIKNLEQQLQQANNTIQKLQKENKEQNQLLNGAFSVEVNGIIRTCKKGLKHAFPEAVKRIDIENQRNKELTAAYNELAKSKFNDISPISPSDDGNTYS